MADKEVVEAGAKNVALLAQILSATAWPVTTLICVFALRKNLLSLIPLVRTLKYSDVEIQFGNEVAAVARTARDAALPKELAEERGSWEDLILLAQVKPRSAIRAAWRRVEESAFQAAKREHIEIADAAQSMPMVVGSILLNQGLISVSQYDLMSRLRRLVNEAEQAPPDAVDAESAVEFIGLALRLAASIHQAANQT